MTDEELLAEVKRRFIVRPSIGKIFWKKPPRNYPHLTGKEAGTLVFSDKWYRAVKVAGRVIKSARIIYLYSKGRLPRPCADHKNGDALDDRITNLREANHLQNAQNRRLKIRPDGLPTGVRKTASGRFEARISIDRRLIRLGLFDKPGVAHAAYLAKRKECFGEFA